MIVKNNPVRSQHLRKSARDEDCTLQVAGVCNFDPSTTVLAHIDSESKGVGIKSSDLASVYACSACHVWLDQHQGSEEDRLYYSLRGVFRTQQRMLQKGLIEVKGYDAA